MPGCLKIHRIRVPHSSVGSARGPCAEALQLRVTPRLLPCFLSNPSAVLTNKARKGQKNPSHTHKHGSIQLDTGQCLMQTCGRLKIWWGYTESADRRTAKCVWQEMLNFARNVIISHQWQQTQHKTCCSFLRDLCLNLFDDTDLNSVMKTKYNGQSVCICLYFYRYIVNFQKDPPRNQHTQTDTHTLSSLNRWRWSG